MDHELVTIDFEDYSEHLFARELRNHMLTLANRHAGSLPENLVRGP